MIRLEAYISVNVEALVDYRMLSVLPHDLLKRISSSIRMEQLNKAPTARSSFFVDLAMEKYRNWLSLQDIPEPIVRTRPIKGRLEVPRRRPVLDGPLPIPMSRSLPEYIFPMDGISCSPTVPLESPTNKKAPSELTGWKTFGPVLKYILLFPFFYNRKELKHLSRHDMRSIIAETEKNATSRTPPTDGLSTMKWIPRTPPRPDRMPPAPGLPMPSSPGKKAEFRRTPATTPGPSTVARPNHTSSGLSITRPRGVGPALAVANQQTQTPQKALTPEFSAHTHPLLARTRSTQLSQPGTPVKLFVSSSSIQRTSLVSSLDRLSLVLIFIVPGVAASHGRTCLANPLSIDNRPKVV